VPLSTGFLCPGMGSTGGRDEIGAMPYWYRLALASESPTLENFARVADGNSLAAFPVHMRPAENRQPGTYCDEPIRMMFDLSTRVNHVFVDGKGCRQYADSGHIPDTSYYTYLATGEKFYEEEMAFWSSSQLWTWAKKDSVEKDWHLPTHNRYSGWPLRNATNAAFVLPDSHPMKKYLHDFVQRTVEYQANLVKDPVKYWNAESRPSGGWQWFSGHCAFWQHCFFVWSLDNAARKGFYPVAAEARDGAADLLIRMYLCDEEFKAPDGKTYRNDPLQAIPYQMAIDVRAMDFTDPKNVKETFLRTLADNTGAIYYYTAVNEQNAYPQVTDELLAKLPKKIMQPEDWRFDPEITRKRDEVEVRKSLGNPGYHDEANGPTSAALARYDNPKAQKMYEFVRGLIEKAYGPNRIRGVEYVK